MARLFKRSFSLAFARVPKGQFFPTDVRATVITDLRVAFEIEKEHTIAALGETSQPQPNRCRISIWNLAPATRAALELKPTYVRLEAGYDGETRRMFEGDIVFAVSRREGVDWVTDLQVMDGARAVREARVNRSYPRGTPGRVALGDIAEAMGLKPPRSNEVTALAAQYVNGLALYGNAARELTRVLAPHGYSWSIQDGRLIILRDTDVRPDQMVKVDQDAGLIGSPAFGTPERQGKKPVLTARMLLHPGILPMARVKVASLTANGVFRVDRVTHTGDSFGNAWFTEFEARAV